MTRLTRAEIAVVIDRLELHDCLHDVITEEAPEMGADLDDVRNACDTTIAELEELELEEMVKHLTGVQRFCLIDAVEGSTQLVRFSRGDAARKGVYRACLGAERKLSVVLGVEISFPRD